MVWYFLQYSVFFGCFFILEYYWVCILFYLWNITMALWGRFSSEHLVVREDSELTSKQELAQLKDIIKNDNINFSEKKEYALFDKLDRKVDDLFDSFVMDNRGSLKKNIFSLKYRSAEEKTADLQKAFHTFLDQELKKNPAYTNQDIQNFKNILEEINTEKLKKQESVIELSSLELHVLENTILSSLSAGSDYGRRVTGNNITHWKTTTVDYWTNNFTDKYTEKEKTISESNIPEEETKDKNIVISTTQQQKEIDPIINNNTTIYRADSYVKFSKTDGDIESGTPEEKALKKILKGKENALLVVDQNNHAVRAEKKLLKNLRNAIDNIGIDNFWDSIKEVTKLYFQEWPNKDRSEETKEIAELGKLFTLAMQPGNDFPYFSRVLKLFSETFAKNPNTSFVEIYNTLNNSSSRENLWLVKENRNIFQRMFNSHNKAFNLLEKTSTHLDRKAAKELYSRSKKLDINRTIENNLRRVEESRNQWYKNEVMKGKGEEAKFISFLVEQLEPIAELDQKENHLYEVLIWSVDYLDPNQNYLNPNQISFLHLLNSFRLGMNIEQYANTKHISTKIEERSTEEERLNIFIDRISDLNKDGRIDFWDWAIRTGLQLRSYYETAIDDVGEEKVLENLVDIALTHANTKQFGNYRTILEQIKNIQNYSGDNGKIARFVRAFEDPGFITFMQKVLLESPLDPNLLLTQGKDAFKHYSEMIDELNEQDKKIIYNYIDQQLINYDVDPIIKEGIFQSLATPLIQARQQGLGMGIHVSLDQLIKGVSINIGAGIVDGSPAVLWVHLARNKNFALNNDTNIYTGTSLGLVNGFIPVASVGGWVEKWITNKNKKTLNSYSAKKIAIGPNITLIWGVIPSVGVSVGFGVDKQKGIEEQSEYIKQWITPIVEAFLKTYDQLDGTKTESIKSLSKILRKQFPNSDQETLMDAANNIYTTLVYFWLTDSDRATIQKHIKHFSSLVTEFYVTNRKNEQTFWLDRWHFSNASLGVQFLAGYYPIPTLCVKIAKYKSFYFKDTQESLQLAKQSEITGFWNEYKETNSPDDIIDNLNRSLPMDNYRISLSADKKYFIIPKALYNKQNINIKIDPSLKWYLKETDQEWTKEKSLQVPVFIALRHRQSNQGMSRVDVLNIGDIKTEHGDLNLNPGKSLPKDWIGDKEIIDPTIDLQKALTTKIDAFIKKYPEFPISKVIITGNTVTYYDKQNNPISELQDISLRKSILIDRTSGDWYKITITDSEDHIISYKGKENISRKYPPIKINSINSPFEKIITDKEIWDILVKLDNLGSSTTITDFEYFLEQGISSKNIEKTSKTLINLLNPHKNNSKVKLLIDTLFTGTQEQKMMIINHIKSIFAYESDFETHEKIVTAAKRRTWWKNVAWNSGETPSEVGLDIVFDWYKTELLKGENFDIDPTSLKNVPIFWYTAWYRAQAYNKSKNWSMTLPGYTNILKTNNNLYVKKIQNDPENPNDTPLEKTKSWFLDNFQDDIQEQLLFKKTLSSLIAKTYSKLPTKLTQSIDNLDRENTKKLLSSWENTIDIWDKKYKLKLDADRLFYLLQECANESIGFVPKSIEIEEIIPTPVEEKLSITPPKIGLRINTTGTINRANAAQKIERGINLTFVKQKPKDEDTTVEVEPDDPVEIEVNPENRSSFTNNGDGTYTYTNENGVTMLFRPDDPTAFADFLSGTTENTAIFTGMEAPTTGETSNERIVGNGDYTSQSNSSLSGGIEFNSKDKRIPKKK